MSWTNEEILEAVTKVIEKAGMDAKIRELVLTDVYSAVKEVTGKEIPKEFKINVVDGTGYHVNIVLPEMRSAAEELTETELDAVAGGVIAPPIRPGESLEDYRKRLEHYRRIGIVF